MASNNILPWFYLLPTRGQRFLKSYFSTWNFLAFASKIWFPTSLDRFLMRISYWLLTRSEWSKLLLTSKKLALLVDKAKVANSNPLDKAWNILGFDNTLQTYFLEIWKAQFLNKKHNTLSDLYFRVSELFLLSYFFQTLCPIGHTTYSLHS